MRRDGLLMPIALRLGQKCPLLVWARPPPLEMPLSCAWQSLSLVGSVDQFVQKGDKGHCLSELAVNYACCRGHHISEKHFDWLQDRPSDVLCLTGCLESQSAIDVTGHLRS